jgi:hypothetical protein
MNHTTDTPRTDAAKSYWDSAERENCVSIVLARELELEAVTYKNEALSLRDSHDLLYRDYQKLEAEVERLDQMVEWFIENAPHFTLAQFNEHQRTLNSTNK